MENLTKREYDKDVELSKLLESLKNLNNSERKKIMEKIRKIIFKKYKCLEQVAGCFLITLKNNNKKETKRWYDKETYSKIIFNLLGLINDEELFNDIKKYLKIRLKKLYPKNS